MYVSRESVPSRAYSKYKGPEAGVGFFCLRNQKEDSMDKVRGREVH